MLIFVLYAYDLTKRYHFFAALNKRYINDTLKNTPITEITEIDLKKYTQTLTHEQTMKKKAYLSYKCVLNLIFEYAVYHKIIVINPVSAIKNRVYLKSCDNSRPKNNEKILSEAEIEMVKKEVNDRMQQPRYKGYCVYAYVVRLAIETRMRAAELCALREDDIQDECIHIHAQQLYEKRPGGKHYYYANHTKDEKGISQGGRLFPLLPEIRQILDMNKQAKDNLGLDCEYVFCTLDNVWIKTDAYETFLRRMLTSLGLSVTNNHAFRMSLNSNVLIPKGLDTGDRAALLGHSIATNLNYYSFSRKDRITELVDILSDNPPDNHDPEPQVTTGHTNVIPFRPRKRALNPGNSKLFTN